MSSAPQPEIVVALVGRTEISTLLTALHRHGYGHVTRVLDPDRSDVAGQLRRAGGAVPPEFGPVANGQVGVMVSAPARTKAAADLLLRAGATAVWEIERTAAQHPFLIGPLVRKTRSRQAFVPEEEPAD